jgi:CRISPR-associated exonuclease Cas4
MSKSPTKKLISYMQKSIKEYAKQHTANTLGDRSKYIGASDIGGCPYKTVMSKRNPPEISLEQELIFFRGHIAEEFVSRGLIGLNIEEQLEVKSELSGFPLMAHIDKIVKGKQRDVIIEVKSTSAPLYEPYESWTLQVTFQMGLYYEQHGKIPDAYVVAVDVNSGWIEEFKIEFDDAIFELCLSKADHLIAALRGECEPKAIVQYYCGTCPFKMECPKQGQFAEDLPSALLEDIEFIKASKVMAKEAKKREARVKEYMVNMGISSLKETTTNTVVTNREMLSSRINTHTLKTCYPEIYKECIIETSYYRMNIL